MLCIVPCICVDAVYSFIKGHAAYSFIKGQPLPLHFIELRYCHLMYICMTVCETLHVVYNNNNKKKAVTHT